MRVLPMSRRDNRQASVSIARDKAPDLVAATLLSRAVHRRSYALRSLSRGSRLQGLEPYHERLKLMLVDYATRHRQDAHSISMQA